MTVLVAVETVLLVLVLILVAGLLRSHAELLRRLGTSPDAAGAPAVPRRDPGEPAPAISGSTPAGDAVGLSFEGVTATPTLLAFLTTGCSTCAGFWDELGEHRLPAGVRTVIVTHGAEREQPARLQTLARQRVPVVMSSAAWEQYAVPGAPYFVLVDHSVRGEGVATTWRALTSLVADAIKDDELSVPRRGVDETLAAAGIGPEHPSLYPGGREPS